MDPKKAENWLDYGNYVLGSQKSTSVQIYHVIRLNTGTTSDIASVHTASIYRIGEVLVK